MVEVRRFFICEFEDLFHFAGEGGIAIDLNFRAKTDDSLHFSAHRVIVEIHVSQDVYGDSLA